MGGGQGFGHGHQIVGGHGRIVGHQYAAGPGIGLDGGDAGHLGQLGGNDFKQFEVGQGRVPESDTAFNAAGYHG